MFHSFIDICKNCDIKKIKDVYYEAKLPLLLNDKEGNSPIHIAIHNNDENLLRFLISKNLFNENKNQQGITPLMLTLINNNIDFFIILSKEYDDDYVSAIINSEKVKAHSHILNTAMELIQHYDENCILPDEIQSVSTLSNVDQLLEHLDDLIFSEKWDDVKKTIIDLYKLNELTKDDVSRIYINVLLKNNFEMLIFIETLFETKEIELNESHVDLIFLKGTLDHIHFIKNKNTKKLKEISQSYKRRGSISLLEYIRQNEGLDVDYHDRTMLMSANNQKDYVEYIKKTFSISDKDYARFVVRLTEDNDFDVNEFIIGLLKNNIEITYQFNQYKNNLLMNAINLSNYQIVDFLVDYYPYLINVFNNSQKNALFVSALGRSLEIFQKIANSPNTNLKLFDQDLNNVLHLLLKKNDPDMMEKILSMVDLINDEILLSTNKLGETPLYLMCLGQHTELIKLLISKKIINDNNINYPSLNKTVADFFDLNVLHAKPYVYQYRSVTEEDIERELLDSNIIFLSRKLYLAEQGKLVKKDILFTSFINKAKSFETFLLLKGYGININGIDSEDVETPLMSAIRRGDQDMALFLINSGADLNTQIEQENNLTLAVKNKLDTVVYWLLKNKIDVNTACLNDEPTYLNWKKFVLLPEEKLTPLNFEKQIVKKGLFDKIKKIEYKIEKTDNEETILKKIILNAYDDSKTFNDFFEKITELNIQYDIMFLGQKFFNIVFIKGDLGFSLNDLNIKREDIKEKLNYNYFELKKLKGEKNESI